MAIVYVPIKVLGAAFGAYALHCFFSLPPTDLARYGGDSHLAAAVAATSFLGVALAVGIGLLAMSASARAYFAYLGERPLPRWRHFPRSIEGRISLLALAVTGMIIAQLFVPFPKPAEAGPEVSPQGLSSGMPWVVFALGMMLACAGTWFLVRSFAARDPGSGGPTPPLARLPGSLLLGLTVLALSVAADAQTARAQAATTPSAPSLQQTIADCNDADDDTRQKAVQDLLIVSAGSDPKQRGKAILKRFLGSSPPHSLKSNRPRF